MKYRFRPLASALLLALAAGGAASTTEAGAGSEEPLFQVRARLLGSAGVGPTRELTSNWDRLRVGDRTELHLFAGVFSFEGTRFCSHGSGSVPSSELEPAGRQLRWRLEAELVGAEPDSMTVALAWSRTASQGPSELSRQSENLSLKLPHGGRRILDFASFPPESGGDCSGRRYAVELETRYLGDPRFVGRPLEFDIWFLRTTETGVEELGHRTLRAEAGEEVDFRFLPLGSKTVLGWTTEGSEEVALYRDCGGTLRAWLLDDDRVSVLADTSFAQLRRHADGEPLATSSGRGRKLFEARLGETTEIRFPALSGHMSMSSERLRLAEPRPRGLAVEGDQVVLELGEHYDGIHYSIRVTVRTPS